MAANCVFAPTDNKSDVHIYPPFFHMGSGLQDQLSTKSAIDIFYGNQSNSNDSRPRQLAIF